MIRWVGNHKSRDHEGPSAGRPGGAFYDLQTFVDRNRPPRPTNFEFYARMPPWLDRHKAKLLVAKCRWIREEVRLVPHAAASAPTPLHDVRA
jgi:hypothetical protein